MLFEMDRIHLSRLHVWNVSIEVIVKPIVLNSVDTAQVTQNHKLVGVSGVIWDTKQLSWVRLADIAHKWM